MWKLPSSAAALRLSLALVLIAAALGTVLRFPYLRGLLWIHLRRTPPERYVLPLPGLPLPALKPGFGAPRALGPHEGIDLFSPAGTPVLAVAEGIVIENRPTPIGGNIVWVLGSARRLYYYAHLREVAPGLRGRRVFAGEALGTVGNTGNAVSTPPHLHFAIYRVTSDLLPLRYEATDPYPLLIAHGRTVGSPIPPPREAGNEAPSRSIPVSPVEALALSRQQVAERAERSAERLASLLATLDPFLGVDADGDVWRVERIYTLSNRLREQAVALREMDPKDGAAPLRDLAAGAAEAGRRLFVRTRRLELVLDEHERCAPRELGAFLSALETLALEVEESEHIAGMSPAERHADYFFFESRPPSVVPEEGGWLVLVGPQLGKGEAPSVDLVVNDRDDALVRLAARGVSEHAIAVRIGPELVADHAGACLFLRLDSGAGSGLGNGGQVAESTPARIPMCLPTSHGSQYRVRAQIAYRKPTTTRLLDSDEIVLVNTSCNERQRVSERLEWALQPGGQLLDPGRGESFQINDASIDCRIESNGVTCAGTLAPATCELGDAGRVDTEWHQIFAPIEQYPDLDEHRSAVLADPVEAAPDATRACVEIPRDDASRETLMWFELFAVNGHQQSAFFSSPRETVTAPTRTHYEVGSHGIEAELDPLREPGKASICVTVRSPQCGV